MAIMRPMMKAPFAARLAGETFGMALCHHVPIKPCFNFGSRLSIFRAKRDREAASGIDNKIAQLKSLRAYGTLAHKPFQTNNCDFITRNTNYWLAYGKKIPTFLRTFLCQFSWFLYWVCGTECPHFKRHQSD